MASFRDYIDVETGVTYSVTFYSGMKYRFDDGTTLSVVPAAAWCFDCGRLVVAEHIASDDEIAMRRMKLLSIISGSKEYIHDFVGTVTKQDAERKLAKYEHRWVVFKARKTRERCLTCGGVSLQKVHGELTVVKNGPTLKSDAYGWMDVGLEPKIVLNFEGQVIER